MKIEAVELRRIALPLVGPFRTSFGTQTARGILLVRLETPDAEGWGECVALVDPVYSSEYVQGAQDVTERYLTPALLGDGDVRTHEVAPLLARVHGHRMAKAAVEMAVLDAELRAAGRSWAAAMGAATDGVNAGDDSDRLLVTWRLRAARVEAAARGERSATPTREHLLTIGAIEILTDDGGRPSRAASPARGMVLLAATPPDIGSLRTTDPSAARAWRHAVRGSVGAALADGWRATGMTRHGAYVLTPDGQEVNV